MGIPRTRLIILAGVPVAAGLVVWSALALRGDPGPHGVIEVEGRMPPIEGPAVVGRPISPSLYRGNVVVVNFWASSCPPCRQEQPGLQRLSRDFRGRDVRFVGVDHMDGLADARRYLAGFGVTYPSVQDPVGELAPRFGVPYLPATVIVDGDGMMRYRLVGAQSEETVRRYVEELLAEG